MGKADSFFTHDENAMDTNFGVRPAGHQLASFDGGASADIRFAGTKRDMNAKLIAVDRIIAKEQVRKNFDQADLEELAHSLRTLGQKTPILVYWSGEDERYVVIAGERRWRAAQLAGLEELACQVHPHKPEEAELVELQFVENAIRSDLNPIEEAQSYKRLQDLKGYSANQLAERIGKNQTTISRSLRMLSLPESVQQSVATGKIPVSVAREIIKVEGEAEQLKMAERYLAGQLTTTQAQAETVKKPAGGREPAKNSKKWTQDGITITVSHGRGVTLADVAIALEERARLLRSDGRSKKAA